MEKPWYRQLWPWLVMLPPAAAVVAGLGTVYIAVNGADDVITDDYVKVGLEVREDRSRIQQAEVLGLAAHLQWDDEGGFSVALNGPMEARPDALRLRLVHPTEDAFDQEAVLAREADGYYRARLPKDLSGAWRVEISPAEGGWLLVEQLDDIGRGYLTLGTERS